MSYPTLLGSSILGCCRDVKDHIPLLGTSLVLTILIAKVTIVVNHFYFNTQRAFYLPQRSSSATYQVAKIIMTERIYYTQSYQQRFTATVIAIQARPEELLIQLDQTCFYPTSGGQAFDTGQLAGRPVVDVWVDEQGNVQHRLAPSTAIAPAEFAIGNSVEGVIDWARRYDHMQQHSGQHLLSQLFYQQYGVETLSVHFGVEESTVDLAMAEIAMSQMAGIERRANELVYAALPIHAYLVDEERVKSIPLRRPPKVSGMIRIVEIDGFDYSACSGTHCRTTAEIGPIKLTKVERQRNGVRVSFLCGRRAYLDYAEKHRLLTEAAMLFNNEIQQVPPLIARNLDQLQKRERALAACQAALLMHEATALAHGAERIGSVKLVHCVVEEHNAEMIKPLAIALQTNRDLIALLARSVDDKVTLCFACNILLAQRYRLNMGELLRASILPLGGKGGGKADFAQGGGIATSQIAIALSSARRQLLTLFHDELTKEDDRKEE